MGNYQLTQLSLSTRYELASQMLDPNRPWGWVSETARNYQVSRKFLYQLRERASESVQAGLMPQRSGRKANVCQINIDEQFVRRAITICLSIIPGTVRTVQSLLELLFGIRRSVGYISQTARSLGNEARSYNQGLRIPIQALAEADEIYQGQNPCLTLVDGRSFLVLNLSAQAHRDATTWGCVLLDVQKQGVQLVDVASDGAEGILSGVKEISTKIPLRPDLFHLIRSAHRVSQRLERHAYKLIATVERARKAEQENNLPKRRQGAPMKVKMELQEAQLLERQAIDQFDTWQWLIHEIRQALEPITQHHHLVNCHTVRETISAALELLATIDNSHIQSFIKQFIEKSAELLAPLEWLEQTLSPLREGLSLKDETLILWAWQNQKELGVSYDAVLPLDQQDLVMAFWNTLSLFHRSSSLAESLHSWIRPFLQAHRGMPDWLFPLLQLVWNHHVFTRGKRKGKSPMAWAEIENIPTLSSLFDWLANPCKTETGTSLVFS